MCSVITGARPVASQTVIGLDIGGTKCAVSHLVGDRVVEVLRVPTGEFAATFAELAAAIAPLVRGPAPLFGISCGGPLDTVGGIIVSPPNLPSDWHGVPIVEHVTERFGGQAVLMNDANACALAEWQFGAGRGCSHMVFLTSGTGIGAGLILNGQLYEGATGDAGEIGHIRLRPEGPVGYGKAGSVEGFASGGGIVRLARERLTASAQPLPVWFAEPTQQTTKQIAEAARRGERAAQAILQEAGERLGEMLAILVDLFNPERIILGGFYPPCATLLEPALSQALRREALPVPARRCDIVPSTLGDTIGSHGAIAAALHARANDRLPRGRVEAPASHLDALVTRVPELGPTKASIERAYAALHASLAGGGKLLLCGNGGSASDAEHWAGELLKGFRNPRPLPSDQQAGMSPETACQLQQALAAIPLTGFPALATAFANDVNGEMTFAQLTWALGKAGDVWIGLSTSGNARNVCAAAEVARARGLVTLALTGQDGGRLASTCDIAIRAPATETYRVQEYHLPIYHCLSLMLEDAFFGPTYGTRK